MLTDDERREAAVTIANDAARGVDPEVIREHLAEEHGKAGPVDVAEIQELLATADLDVGWDVTTMEKRLRAEVEELRDRVDGDAWERLERDRDQALAAVESARVAERADIARQITMLAGDDRLFLDWLSTCSPPPLTVLDVLTALAGKLTAGDAPTAAAAPQSIPVEWERALLRQANGEAVLTVAEPELLDHSRTAPYRSVIQAAYRVGHAVALGYEIEVGGVDGDRLLVGDRITPAESERPAPAPAYHWSRGWGPSDVERMCPCPSAPCGYVIRGEESPDCVEHAGNRTMRGGHPADRCPGSRS